MKCQLIDKIWEGNVVNPVLKKKNESELRFEDVKEDDREKN